MKVVIARSFARIFFRNSINVGVLPVVCPEADKIADGAKISLNIKEGFLEADGKKYAIEPVPAFMQGIIDAGGLVEYAKNLKEVTGMYKIAAIGGDGIGPEIVAEGKKVLEAAGEGSTSISSGRTSISGLTATLPQRNSSPRTT